MAGWDTGGWDVGPWDAPPSRSPSTLQAPPPNFGPDPRSQLVPLSNSPNQTILVSVQVDGASVTYQLSLHYNEMAGYWVIDIADSAGSPLLSSVPLIGGQAPAGNLLAQFAHLGLGGMTVVNASGVDQDYPDNTNLGSDFLLIWYQTQQS